MVRESADRQKLLLLTPGQKRLGTNHDVTAGSSSGPELGTPFPILDGHPFPDILVPYSGLGIGSHETDPFWELTSLSREVLHRPLLPLRRPIRSSHYSPDMGQHQLVSLRSLNPQLPQAPHRLVYAALLPQLPNRDQDLWLFHHELLRAVLQHDLINMPCTTILRA